MTDRRALWRDWKYRSFARSLYAAQWCTITALTLQKRISSSFLIIWSIISVRMVGASAMFLLRLFSAASPTHPTTHPNPSLSHQRGICWVKLIWWTGAARAGWKPKQQWLSDSQAPPCPPPLHCRARSARFLSPSGMENSQVLLEPNCILAASCRSGVNLLIFW